MRNANIPLRVIVAPAGYGKTVALVRYLQSVERAAIYVRAQPDESAASLRAKIASALDMDELPDYASLVGALAEHAPCDLAIDALDLASDEAIDQVNALVHDTPEGVHLLIASCSHAVVRSSRLFSQGLAAQLDDRALAFTASDVVHLCEVLDVAHDPADAASLVSHTEGWPTVVCAVVRWSAAENHALRGSLEAWRAIHADFIREFVVAELRRVPAEQCELFTRAANSDALADTQWRLLERRGLFVVRNATGERHIHPLVRELFAVSRPESICGDATSVAPLQIRLFGSIDVSYAGHSIVWTRKRELELIKYLALSPRATATREELIERFWPTTERQVAGARLRTACSNIRRVLAARVGSHAIGKYFRTDGVIGLDLRNVVIDAHHFNSHIQSGQDAFASGDVANALLHFRAAERLYGGEFLDGDRDPKVRAAAEQYRGRYLSLLLELGRVCELGGADDDAMHYTALASRVSGALVQPPRMRERSRRQSSDATADRH